MHALYCNGVYIFVGWDIAAIVEQFGQLEGVITE